MPNPVTLTAVQMDETLASVINFTFSQNTSTLRNDCPFPCCRSGTIMGASYPAWYMIYLLPLKEKKIISGH